MKIKILRRALIALSCSVSLCGIAGAAEPVTVTLIHTNDLHSHFRPERTKLGLGGLARIKTTVDQLRQENPNSLLLDGGDWSEGNIYYNLGTGTETLKTMESMGYDVAVVGNHDWLNGPDILLDSYVASYAPGPSGPAAHPMSLVAANIELEDYGRSSEFKQIIPPYVVKNVGGVKIAFIGVVTQEFIYDRFFAPVKIVAPQSIVRDLAHKIRAQKIADAVVVISHNNIKRNEEILRSAPDVDLVIGAHDHVKLTQPDFVKRFGARDGWVVETGCWGRFVGRVDVKVTPGQGLTPLSYKLIQMDASVPEDPEMLGHIESLEDTLEKHYGPIFHDHVADNRTEISRVGFENRMGNLATDAYMQAVHADFALDQVNMIYGELHEGELHTVDFMNANPAIHDPKTDRAWTLKTFPLKGRTLKWALNLLFAASKGVAGDVLSQSLVSTSGLQFSYSPILKSKANQLFMTLPDFLGQVFMMDSEGSFVVNDPKIQGKPLDPNANYKVVAGDGILFAIRYINSMVPNAIPLDGLQDTGLEDWKVVADYSRELSPITPDEIPIGNRIRTNASDLGVLYDDISLVSAKRQASAMQATVRVKVQNFGMTPSPARGVTLKLLADRNGTNQAIEPNWDEVGSAQAVPQLAPGNSTVLKWQVRLPIDKGLYSVTPTLSGIGGEVNHSNDQVTRWFSVGRHEMEEVQE
jgi:2',3'-cyclic-nucleotide 2'-phosphodiesterase (5'-nucleotidase family)